MFLCACLKACAHILYIIMFSKCDTLSGSFSPPNTCQRSEARRREKLQQQQQEASAIEDGYVMDGAPQPAPYLVCRQSYIIQLDPYTVLCDVVFMFMKLCSCA